MNATNYNSISIILLALAVIGLSIGLAFNGCSIANVRSEQVKLKAQQTEILGLMGRTLTVVERFTGSKKKG